MEYENQRVNWALKGKRGRHSQEAVKNHGRHGLSPLPGFTTQTTTSPYVEKVHQEFPHRKKRRQI